MTDQASVDTPKGRVSYVERGTGTPLVILHSLLTDRHAFDGVLDRLPGRVISLDLPGYGGSDPAEPAIESYADQMAAAVAHLCDTGAVVLGNGLGSFVALSLAIRHPELVSRLVLVGAGASFPEEARPAFGNMARLVEESGMSAVTPTALRRIFTEEFLESHPEEASERSRVLEAADPQVFVAACRALQHVDLAEGAAGVTVPVLIVVGDQDAATPPEMANALDAILPDSRVVVLPGIAHAPQLQDPDGFIETIERFLEGE